MPHRANSKTIRLIVLLMLGALAGFLGTDVRGEDDPPTSKVDYKKKLKELEDAYLKTRTEALKELEPIEKKAKEALDQAQKDLNKAGVDKDARTKALAAVKKAQEEMNNLRNLRLELERPKLLAAPPPPSRPEEGGRLGAKYSQVSDALAAQLGLEKGKGQAITEVVKDRPAAKAGLQVHDVLVKLDGKDVPSDTFAFRKLLAGIKGGETPVEAVIVRQGKQQTVQLTVPVSDQPASGTPPAKVDVNPRKGPAVQPKKPPDELIGKPREEKSDGKP